MTQPDDSESPETFAESPSRRPLIIGFTVAAIGLSAASVGLTDLSAVFGIATGIVAVIIAVLAWGGENYLEHEKRRRREVTVAAEIEIERNTWRDSATGLFTYSWFEQALEREVSRSARYGQACAVIRLDLNLEHLYAHSPIAENADPSGIWKFIADVVTSTVRETDSVARRPGEFSVAILLPQSGAEGGNLVLSRLNERLESDLLHLPDIDPLIVQFRQQTVSYLSDGATAQELLSAIQEAH